MRMCTVFLWHVCSFAPTRPHTTTWTVNIWCFMHTDMLYRYYRGFSLLNSKCLKERSIHVSCFKQPSAAFLAGFFLFIFCVIPYIMGWERERAGVGDCLYAHSVSSSTVVIMDMESSCAQVKRLFFCFVAGYICVCV